MKKIYSHIFLSGILFLSFFSPVFAAEIHFSADKTMGTTDDIFEVHLSVDGEVDGGQVGIEGLENFDIVGQQSSSQVQVVNGNVTSVQEKIISLAPKKEGNFTITALAKENGEEIRSTPVSFSVSKSLVQQTKENLLKNSKENTQEDATSFSAPPSPSANNNQKKEQSDIAKKLLTSPSNVAPANNTQDIQALQTPKINDFPKVEHISAFNGIFWIQFLGITSLIISIFFLLQKKYKKH